ncbi:hypothetical protein I5M32_12280 [Pedobacter sp. SD-b]|uniref:Glycine zipper n=1 Tax=Pedobacter segetis TaxID=2793069 RepID=A0ABS1BLI0_9SPHI|nr:hypothetical protein [Pedobacter segetis]MBK0383737.1 hypothetical protein [Pedobacter segetis]
MEEKIDFQDYNWIYYVVGLVCGAISGLAVEGHVIIGAILGLLTGGLFQFLINKSREEVQ